MKFPCVNKIIDLVPFKRPAQQSLEAQVLEVSSRLNKEILKSKSIMDLVSGMRNNPPTFRDKKNRINPKSYRAICNSISTLSAKIGETKNNMKAIARDYASIKKSADPASKQALVGAHQEIKNSFLSLKQDLQTSQAYLDIAGRTFSINHYELIKEKGFELKISKVRNKFVKPVAIVATSLLIGGAGFTGFKKYVNINLSEVQKPGIEQRLEQPPTVAFDQVVRMENYQNKDAPVENAIIQQGKVPILMYHRVQKRETRYAVSPERFRAHLQKLYDNGFQTIGIEDYLDKDFSSLLAGKKPVVLTFDDANEGQFEYLTFKDDVVYDKFGNPRIDPDCALGIFEKFVYRNPDFGDKLVFFVDFDDPPFMQEGSEKSKLLYLIKEGHDVCYHGNAHRNMASLSLDEVKKEIDFAKAGFEYFLDDKTDLVKKIWAPAYGALPGGKGLDLLKSEFKIIGAGGGFADNPYTSSPSTTVTKRYEMNPGSGFSAFQRKDVLEKVDRTGRGGH